MGFKSFQPATWADVQVGDAVRTASGEWNVLAMTGGEVRMAPAMGHGASVTGRPAMAGAVEILREIHQREEVGREIVNLRTDEPDDDPPPWETPAPVKSDMTSSVRLMKEMDALAMTTAAALVQLRLSAAVLSEQIGDTPPIIESAPAMPIERLRAHLLAYHGAHDVEVAACDDVPVLLGWHHNLEGVPRIPHTHR